MNQGRKILRVLLIIAGLGALVWTATDYAQARRDYAAWMTAHSSEHRKTGRVVARFERRTDSGFYGRVSGKIYEGDLLAAELARPRYEELTAEKETAAEQRRRTWRHLQISLVLLVVLLIIARAITPYEARWQ